MRLYIEGPVNKYYVQTLCMIFFPGSKFSEDEPVTEETPEMWVQMSKSAEAGIDVTVKLSYRGQSAEATRHYDYSAEYTAERREKIAVGDAVTSVCEQVMGYRSSWGMLTGVRPSKVATELLRKGMSKTRIRKELTKDYFAIPRRPLLLPTWPSTRRVSSAIPVGRTVLFTSPSPSAPPDAPTAPSCPIPLSAFCPSSPTTLSAW